MRGAHWFIKNVFIMTKAVISTIVIFFAVFGFGAYYFSHVHDSGKNSGIEETGDLVEIKASSRLEEARRSEKGVARIGYFHGGRTHLLYRAYIHDYFGKEGIDVKLITKELFNDALSEVPKSHEEFEKKSEDSSFFGRMTGIEIIKEIEKGNLDGGTVGEASFIASIHNNSPIVAVAMLGHDEKDYPAHAFLLRNGVEVKSPDDLKGKTFVSRYSGPFDRTMVREFIESEGLKITDVNLVEDVMDDELSEGFKNGKVDGGYYHFHWIKKFVNEDKTAYVYRKLDWVNPESSLALLIFHKDYIKNNRDTVQKIVDAYAKRVKYEKDLSETEREKPKGFGLQMVDYNNIQGMNIPQYDFPPKVRSDLLHQIQDILFKHGEIDGKSDIENYLDLSFVEEAMKNINK